MKKIYTTLVIATLFVSFTFSQSLDIRAYGGVNVLQLSTDNSVNNINGILHKTNISGRPGYQYGAAVTFGEQFFVQPGFQMTSISTTIINESTIDQNVFTDESVIQIVSVPLRVGFRLIDPEKENIFNVRLFGGLDGHHVVKVDHVTKSGGIDDITVDDYTNLILNADFGMGIDLLFFFVDAGYQIGLTPVHTNGDGATSSAFYANFGVKIRL